MTRLFVLQLSDCEDQRGERSVRIFCWCGELHGVHGCIAMLLFLLLVHYVEHVNVSRGLYRYGGVCSGESAI